MCILDDVALLWINGDTTVKIMCTIEFVIVYGANNIVEHFIAIMESFCLTFLVNTFHVCAFFYQPKNA